MKFLLFIIALILTVDGRASGSRPVSNVNSFGNTGGLSGNVDARTCRKDKDCENYVDTSSALNSLFGNNNCVGFGNSCKPVCGGAT